MQDNLDMAIQAYRHALDTLKSDIDCKKWQNLVNSRGLLEQASDVLQVHLAESSAKPEIQNDLKQLSLQHRRVMRQLSQHMQRVQEDLQCVEKALNKADYMSEFVENNL
ncbi:MAG: hypothetical protein Q9M14_04425 [Mariprofundaceae bacterium]|nr:hypothetical protein [Mariprofundaceae bacterium]